MALMASFRTEHPVKIKAKSRNASAAVKKRELRGEVLVKRSRIAGSLALKINPDTAGAGYGTLISFWVAVLAGV